MSGIRLELLGGFDIRLESGVPVSIPARKVRALLAYLALAAGRAHSRDKLAALLWADSGAEQARTSLRQALSALRKALAPLPLLAADADTVMLSPEGWWCDACLFAELAQADSPTARAEAAGLYRGDLLEGFHARAPAFDEWLLVERERLRALAVRALAGLLEHHAGPGGNPAEALAAGARLLVLDPLREDVHRTLMRLYHRQGRQAAALKQYRSCRTVLQRELGVLPEPETERLYREILQSRERQTRDEAPAQVASPPEPHPRQSAGTAPTVSAAGGPELRETVVLCAELDGFAAYAASGDPEEVHGVLSRYRELFNSRVSRYGGVVLSHAGARAMALFGTPRAFGNEAERALHAALAVRETMAAAGWPLPVRQGLASGQVLATRDELGLAVSGEPVTMAGAVLEAARGGEILLSHRVRQTLASRLVADPTLPDELPGCLQGTTVWRANAWRTAEEAHAAIPLVGRRHELAQLAALLEACRAGAGQVVLLRGDAGIGKSRLAEELARRAKASGFACQRVQILDFGGGTAPAAELFAGLLGCTDSATVRERETALAAAVRNGRVDEAAVAFARDLLDLPQPDSVRADFEAMDAAASAQGRRAALVGVLRRESALQARIVIVEDVHWADAATLDDLAELAARLADRPIMLVLTSRTEDDPLDAGWRAAARGCRLTTLDLGPLDSAESFELARHYSPTDEAFVRACVTRADGNPLFLDQLLRAAGASPGFVPGSLQSLVLARMDRLDRAERDALQAAAVLGQRFAQAPLQHLLDREIDCGRLVEQGLVRRDGADFRFDHALIQQAVYASLLKSRRRAWHRRAAGWFAGRDPELVARHLDAAGDAGAAEAYLASARAAAARHRYDTALRWVERGLDLAEESLLLCELACQRAELLRELGDTAGSVEAFRRAVALACDDRQRCRAWLGLAAGLRILDRYHEALEALEHAEAAAGGPDSAEAMAQIHDMRGNVHFPLGNFEACLAAHEQARRWAARCGSPLHEAQAMVGLGDAWYQRGRMRTAREYFARCVAIAREHDLRRVEVASLPMLAVTDLYCLELAQAAGHARAALEKAEAIGDLRGAMMAHLVACAIAPYRGEIECELEHAERALQLARRLGARRFEAETLANCGHARLGAGRRDEAVALLEEARALSRSVGERYIGPIIEGWMALATEDRQRRQTALAHGEALLAEGCVSHCHIHFHEAAIDASLASGDYPAALRHADALETYTREEPLAWADFVIRRARALVRLADRGDAADALETLGALRAQALAVGMLGALPSLDAALGAAPRWRFG